VVVFYEEYGVNGSLVTGKPRSHQSSMPPAIFDAYLNITNENDDERCSIYLSVRTCVNPCRRNILAALLERTPARHTIAHTIHI
jgi:hypothetical protein